MSLLATLSRAYDRLPDAPAHGFSAEKIGFCVLLNPDGSVASVEDLRDDDKKRSPRILQVPQPPIRTSGLKACFLWDKTAYALGIGGKEATATPAEHDFFKAEHERWLAQTTDEGLLAFLGFLRHWTADQLADWPQDISDKNIVFALAPDYMNGYIHDRPAAKRIWDDLCAEQAGEKGVCLVSGETAPIAKLHPKIKNVWGAQSSGASLISFNAASYESYGHKNGDNAPVSEAAAFRYSTALNGFLADKRHRLQVGDASTVFWADASGMVSELAETLFAAMFDSAATTEADDRIATASIAAQLERIRRGDHLAQVEPQLAQGVRFHILGLSPNAARLSVRFYWENDFGQLTRNYQKHLSDTQVQPPPRDNWPPLWRYLVELAVLNKRENIPPNLAGEWMRAILTGAPYPMTLLATALTRIRADGEVNALRAAILKSVLIRNFKMEAPVALDPTYDKSKGYLLGRLFAAYEEVQRAALGGNVNATIKDKFYGAASASPQKVFATLDSGAQNHFSKLRKSLPGRAVNLEKLIMSIMDQMSPGDDPIPAYLNAPEQGLFGLGYYHQRSAFFAKRDDKNDDQPETTA